MNKQKGKNLAKKTKKTEAITKKFGDERKKALDDALKLIEKDFGKGAVMRLGERAEAGPDAGGLRGDGGIAGAHGLTVSPHPLAALHASRRLP